ncbi:luc7-like protein 1 [Dinothrombium tinctorium]|uniref:Luc7-like protein 1 n=1 Tax=Dinothrombium tinctorium TaxID=1965070 RepID=A0A443RK25_9ACAR|nr:luc7-like protein 1 [Dinothrombium tinctorium]
MALQSARQLLDELMGRERDLRPSEKSSDEAEWNDSRICKFFLVKFCPNQLFTNTKADMGPCHKVHDDYIKKMYEEKASRREKMAYEDEFIRFCQQTLNDVERRIKRARQRLAASQTDKANAAAAGGGTPYLSEELQEKMQVLSDRIEQLLQQIEELGCEGKVEEAQGIMKLVEKLKEEKMALKRDNMPMHWIQQRAEIGAAQEKQMEVCDVCGAFLIVNDVQQRVDDHLMGKQHVGYGKLKTALDEILQRRKAERALDEKDEEPKAKEARLDTNVDKSRSRSRSYERERNGVHRYEEKRNKSDSYRESKNRAHSPSNRRHSGRHRDHADRSRLRSRSRSKERRHSYSKDRDRDYDRRSRRKSRSRSRSVSPRK